MKTRPCEKCLRFRKVKQPSQLLGAVYTMNHTEVFQMLSKIREDENKLRDEGKRYKVTQTIASKDGWDYL